MNRYEYKEEKYDHRTMIKWVDWLNVHGADGWIFVEKADVAGDRRVLFCRIKP